MSRLSEITNLNLSKPIEIELIGFAWQGQAVISISQILVSGGYCSFPRFVQIFAEQECTFTVPTQFESSLYSIFVRAGSIFDWNKILYTSFLYILSKAQHPLYINMVYKWHDLRFIRLYSSICIFKYLKPLYVEIQCMHPSLTVSFNVCFMRVFLLLKHV